MVNENNLRPIIENKKPFELVYELKEHEIKKSEKMSKITTYLGVSCAYCSPSGNGNNGNGSGGSRGNGNGGYNTSTGSGTSERPWKGWGDRDPYDCKIL